MKKNKYIGLAMMAAGMLVATSCSDFSDYNEAPADAVASGNQTLWENIAQNPQLSDFADLVKKAGFDTELANSRSYTVWAPLNGTYNRSDFDQLNTEDLLRQFVKSHVAQYSYNATGSMNERIHTLNEKSFPFAGNGTYTYDGNTLSQPNLPSINGVMHLMDGAAKFYPNLYEYLKVGADIDSLRNHFMRYELITLDEENSVKGPMVDGVQTYIDSVMITFNSQTRSINARVENEDSSYIFLMPTNKAFMDMYNRVKSTYKFIETTTVQDVERYAEASGTETKKTSAINVNYMTDSLTRRAIVRNLVYSNNDGYNQWVEGDGVYTDTLRSTTRNKFSNPKELLAQAREKLPMSNGTAYIVDSLAFRSWETYCPEIVAPMTRNLANAFASSLHTINVSDPGSVVFGPEENVTSFRYLWIEPSSSMGRPNLFVSLPGVQSTTYKFYCVYLPTAGLAEEAKPNLLNFSLSYCNDKGALATYNFSAKPGDKNPGTLNASTAFINDPLKTDTVYLGQFTFPVCYEGLGDYSPNIHITTPINVYNKTQMATYTRDVRIWAIILKPVDLDEYEANNQ